jgi:ornithine decarboxylase
MDCLERHALLPKLAVGDWLFYPEMGAYTSCAASTFNGFPKPSKFFTYSLNCNSVLQDLPEGFPFRERFSVLYGC